MTRSRAFSLVELVVVVVILGLIATIAIPRISRGASGATDASLRADLAVIRNAIELFAAEHNGIYPGADDIADVPDQLTGYTDIDGNVNPAGTRTSTYAFGPYLNAVPALKVGSERGSTAFGASASSGVAWIYNTTDGTVTANSGSATDANGDPYSDY